MQLLKEEKTFSINRECDFVRVLLQFSPSLPPFLIVRLCSALSTAHSCHSGSRSGTTSQDEQEQVRHGLAAGHQPVS